MSSRNFRSFLVGLTFLGLGCDGGITPGPTDPDTSSPDVIIANLAVSFSGVPVKNLLLNVEAGNGTTVISGFDLQRIHNFYVEAPTVLEKGTYRCSQLQTGSTPIASYYDADLRVTWAIDARHGDDCVLTITSGVSQGRLTGTLDGMSSSTMGAGASLTASFDATLS